MLHKRGFLGAYLLITFTCCRQRDQLVGVCSDRLKKRGLRYGLGSKKGGPRHGSGSKSGGLYRGTYLYWTYNNM